jgi:lysophospholipase L1-like esterase
VEDGCAFWSQQEAMGGWGSMGNWVRGGLAQGDHTHLTATGYTKLADSLAVELMRKYEEYLKSTARN